MGIAAFLLCFAGIVALIWGIYNKVKAGRVSDAPLVSTADAASKGAQVANAKGGISAQGRLVCQQPVISPVTGQQCLYYRLEVKAKWKQGDVTKEKSIEDHRVAAQFCIDDGSGPVWIDATKGGDFDDEKITTQEKGTGLLAGIAGGAIQFGNYTLNAGMFSLGTNYEVKETVWPFTSTGNLYACGKTVNNTIAEPGWRSLIVSGKSRDELLAHATKSAKLSLIGGGVAMAAGVLFGILSAVFAEPAEAKVEPVKPVMTTTAAELPAPSASASAVDTAQAVDTGKPAAAKPGAKPAGAKPAAAKPSAAASHK